MTNQAVPDAARQRDIYQRMSLIFANDERARKTIMAGRLSISYYSPRGQEVIPSTVSSLLTDDDYICTIYRGSHDQLAKGLPPKILWGEWAGRNTGSCKGKGGPMHITYPKKGIMVTTGIVGSSMPIANGLAWGAQLRGDKRVTVAYFGDGAANIGAFHESLNLASLWKLPVVFVCQNNEYGEHTAYAKATAIGRIADRAAAYSMPGFSVDGNDPIAMFGAAKAAIDRAREGEGPTLIEANTFRFFGHVFGDPDFYMTKERKDAAIAADPVPRFRKQLIASKIATEKELDAIDAKNGKEIDEAIEFALASPFPDAKELKRDVYAKELV